MKFWPCLFSPSQIDLEQMLESPKREIETFKLITLRLAYFFSVHYRLYSILYPHHQSHAHHHLSHFTSPPHLISSPTPRITPFRTTSPLPSHLTTPSTPQKPSPNITYHTISCPSLILPHYTAPSPSAATSPTRFPNAY